MKQLLLTFSLALLGILNFNAQSINFTSTLNEAEIGSTVTVTFEYSISSDGYIYCAIELLDDFDYQDTVADAELNPAPAGTNVSGSFDLTIPEGTTPSMNLTGNLNYKIKIELKDDNFNYLDGDFPSTEINLAETLSNTEFDAEKPFTIYPNPSTDFVEINGLDNLLTTKIIIFNTLGKKVFEYENLQSNRINVSSLNSGIYFMLIQDYSSQQTVKFIKK